jgi:hypothetical protein
MRCSFFGIVERYALIADRRPFVCSALTATTLVGLGDLIAQSLSHRPGQVYDVRRTLAMSAWGTVFYGGPQKALYLAFQRVFAGRPVLQVFLDCFINVPFFLLPSMYITTGLLKGRQTWDEIKEQLTTDWLDAVLFSCAVWVPVQYFNFKFLEPRLQILCVLTVSLVHTACMSTFSNRAADWTQDVLAATEDDRIQVCCLTHLSKPLQEPVRCPV